MNDDTFLYKGQKPWTGLTDSQVPADRLAKHDQLLRGAGFKMIVAGDYSGDKKEGLTFSVGLFDEVYAFDGEVLRLLLLNMDGYDPHYLAIRESDNCTLPVTMYAGGGEWQHLIEFLNHVQTLIDKVIPYDKVGEFLAPIVGNKVATDIMFDLTIREQVRGAACYQTMYGVLCATCYLADITANQRSDSERFISAQYGRAAEMKRQVFMGALNYDVESARV